MALFLSGPLVGEIRGSEGGTTFSRNRFGQYTRQRSVPVNPNSSRQSIARFRLAQATTFWSVVLTQVQRDAWILFGNNVSWLNGLGQPVSLPGFQHFVRMFAAFLQGTLSFVPNGPVIFTLPGADSLFAATVSEATQLISVAFDVTEGWVDEDNAGMLVHMNQPVGAGRQFIGPPQRFAGVILGDATTPPTSPQTIAVPYGVAVNQNTIVSYRIGRADGRLSGKFLDPVSVIA